MKPESPFVVSGLAREVLLLQVKLFIEALRDLVISPITMAAALLDVVLSKHQPPRYFHAVLRLGERSDGWIDVWSAGRKSPAQPGSVDALLANVEDIVRDPQSGARRARVLKRWANRQLIRARRAAESRGVPPPAP